MGRDRRLHNIDEVSEMLRLNQDDIQWLVDDTGQIVPVRFRGNELFDSKDIWACVDTYKTVARRRKEAYVRES
ncbi:MAG TPA: hypothetical protein VEB03_00890 [Candidatus Nanoarchaeia archaeon]|nr:hypothetical protein [Candidatus Nanoarchaeia archaeon]